MPPTSLVRQAERAAPKLHGGRRLNDPVRRRLTEHNRDVARLIRKAGGSMLSQAAAFLQGIREARPWNLETDLRMVFGDEVTAIVMQLTEEPTADFKWPYLRRAKLRAKRMRDASLETRTVEIADQLVRVRSLNRSRRPRWTKPQRIEYIWASRRIVEACNGANGRLEALFWNEWQRAARKYLTIHAFHEGLPTCRFSRKFPKDWKLQHTWASVDSKWINCPECRKRLRQQKKVPA